MFRVLEGVLGGLGPHERVGGCDDRLADGWTLVGANSWICTAPSVGFKRLIEQLLDLEYGGLKPGLDNDIRCDAVLLWALDACCRVPTANDTEDSG